MKSIIIVLTITFCVSVVSCTNNPKQQNTIIGGADGSTEIVIDGKNSEDTVVYELQDCLLWYTKQLPKNIKTGNRCCFCS